MVVSGNRFIKVSKEDKEIKIVQKEIEALN